MSFWSRLKYKLTHLNSGMDLFWAIVVALNAYGVVDGLVSGDMSRVLISAAFLALCLWSI